MDHGFDGLISGTLTTGAWAGPSQTSCPDFCELTSCILRNRPPNPLLWLGVVSGLLHSQHFLTLRLRRLNSAKKKNVTCMMSHSLSGAVLLSKKMDSGLRLGWMFLSLQNFLSGDFPSLSFYWAQVYPLVREQKVPTILPQHSKNNNKTNQKTFSVEICELEASPQVPKTCRSRKRERKVLEESQVQSQDQTAGLGGFSLSANFLEEFPQKSLLSGK